jgi:hypothetical protein
MTEIILWPWDGWGGTEEQVPLAAPTDPPGRSADEIGDVGITCASAHRLLSEYDRNHHRNQSQKNS